MRNTNAQKYQNLLFLFVSTGNLVIKIQPDSAWRGTSNCSNCGIRELVLFADLTEADFNLIHSPIDDLAFKQGATLYLQNDVAKGVFTVRSGMLKLQRTTQDGRQRIVRVLRVGDVCGLEALATGRFDSEAIALSDVTLCRIPLDVINGLGANSSRLHMRLMQKWQHALKDADDWLADLNFGTAKQRVAQLVLKMRHTDDASLSTIFSRDDMGAMLDLKLETVSREISRLVKENIISPHDKQNRIYKIINVNALENLNDS